MSFLREIKRRNVFKVGLAYAAISWLLVQIVTGIEAPLNLPGWFDTVVILLLAVGFPVALVFAWAFELTPEGIRPSDQVEPEVSITRQTGRKLNRMTIAVLAVAVVLLLVDRFYPGDRRDAIPNSIAVLPFANLSPDRGDAYFAPGLHEEILNRLEKIQNLTVMARTTMSQYENTDKSIAEIARELNVGAVMEGSVRFANDLVRVTAQLIDPATEGHLWSNTYEGSFEDIFAIESDIAMNVANAMAVEFSLDEQSRVSRIPTESVEAYELYLAAVEKQRANEIEEALALIDTALEKDPGFALALARKVGLLTQAGQAARADRRAELLSDALDSALRAVEIDPDLAEAQTALANVRFNQGNWIEAESAYRRVFGDDIARGAYIFSLAVGRLERGLAAVEFARRNDPLNQTARGWYIAGFAYTGELARAEAEYEQGSLVFGPWIGDFQITMVRMATGAIDTIEDIPARAGIENIARENLQSPDTGLQRLREIFDRNQNLPAVTFSQIAYWAAFFGDPEFALAALEQAVRISPPQVIAFWHPVMRDVRELPGFKELARESGLVSYWNRFAWPDICRPLAGDDLVCD